jgi:hypothetical protein
MQYLRVCLISFVLLGCSKAPDLTAPCPDYGKHCSQIPIN